MSGNKRNVMLFLGILFQYLIVAWTRTSSRNFNVQVKFPSIPLKSAVMATHFPDLTADLSLDGNNVTCASSDWVPKASIDYNLERPARIRAVSLLMHKYVDVHLEVNVGNSSDTPTLCKSAKLNTESDPEVIVICEEDIYGDSISLKDMRKGHEFFVICEANAFGVPLNDPEKLPDSDDNQLGMYVGIGSGVALLVVVVVVIIVFFCRRKSEPRRPSEAHSLNTLSMMASQQVVVQRQRGPIAVPRQNVVTRSIPNAYERPTSLKDSSAIYETIPGDEPPYLVVLGDKDMYDDASSSKR